VIFLQVRRQQPLREVSGIPDLDSIRIDAHRHASGKSGIVTVRKRINQTLTQGLKGIFRPISAAHIARLETSLPANVLRQNFKGLLKYLDQRPLQHPII
jgi:hypothetical protein